MSVNHTPSSQPRDERRIISPMWQ